METKHTKKKKKKKRLVENLGVKVFSKPSLYACLKNKSLMFKRKVDKSHEEFKGKFFRRRCVMLQINDRFRCEDLQR